MRDTKGKTYSKKAKRKRTSGGVARSDALQPLAFALLGRNGVQAVESTLTLAERGLDRFGEDIWVHSVVRGVNGLVESSCDCSCNLCRSEGWGQPEV